MQGNLLLEKSGGGEHQLVGAVVIFEDDRPAICSNFVAKVELAEGMDSSFWRYVHGAAYSVRLQYGSIKQTSGIQNLDQDAYFNERAPFPPSVEQSAIAAFLDRETGQIDALVAEQERLMALLKEKRQAVISQAVTKGLNPNAKMKPSGVEWLGEVPAHWAVKKLGHIAKLQGGFAFSSDSFRDEGIPIVRMNNLKRGSLDLSDATYVPLENCTDNYSLGFGDLVWGMSGSIGETGSLGNYARVRRCDLPAQLNQRVGRFQMLSGAFSVDFLTYIIQTKMFSEQILLQVTGTAQFNVSSDQVEGAKVPCPPSSEQSQITTYLDSKISRFDTLTGEAERAIALLKERRAAMISAAVTGKIDVRGLSDPVGKAA